MRHVDGGHEHHDSEAIDLTENLADENGWWCWLTKHRVEHARVAFEGRPGGRDEYWDFTLPVWQLAVMLWLTSEPYARARLEAIVDAIVTDEAKATAVGNGNRDE